jgi:hypothetical protein
MNNLVWSDNKDGAYLGTACFTIGIRLVSAPRRKQQYKACIRTHPFPRQRSESVYYIYDSIEEAKEKSLAYIKSLFLYEADVAEQQLTIFREIVASI